MAIILLVCLVLTGAAAAPPVSGGLQDWQQELFDRSEWNKVEEVYPAKRSHYGSAYVSPCAAASAPISAYAPVSAPVHAYAHSGTPYYGHPYHTVPAHRGIPQQHYAHSYYRVEDQPENEQEMLEFSDTNQAFDHMPSARSSYGPAPAINAQAASGPVVGVFSNANTGGCSVPLLVSCSPSIAHGRIVKSQPQPYYSDGYREVEQPRHDDEEHQEKAHLSSEHPTHKSHTIGDKHQ